MAITTAVSNKELERVAILAYQGETLEALLCTVGTSGYTADSPVSDWETIEISGNGYQRFSAAIQNGSYNSVKGRYEMPSIDIQFTASGVGYSYNTLVIFLTGEAYPYSVITENPNINMLPDQVQTYRISLITDD